MKILVCVKQVPDMQSEFRVHPSGTGYDEAGLVFRMNSYDEFAVEEAVRIGEKFPDVHITALSVGPARSEAVVRRALEYGAHHGVHIMTGTVGAHSCAPLHADAMETASLIASYTKDKAFDLILFGIMAEDDQRCQVGPMVAALLDIPCATTVIDLKLSPDTRSAVAERELEAGRRESVELPLPAAITVQSGINIPRYPSLTNKLRAKKQELETIPAESMPAPQRCEQAARSYLPPPARGGVFIEGTLEEKAEKLIGIIHERTNLL